MGQSRSKRQLVASLAPAPELDEVVALETAITRRHRDDAPFGELVLDAPWPPARMLAAKLADERLELRGDLMPAGGGSMRAVRQRKKAAVFVAGDPVVDALAGDAETPSDLADLPAVLHHGHHCLIALFHDAELHQHLAPPPRPTSPSEPGDERCQTSPETPVI
jgi:hypothetical protein